MKLLFLLIILPILCFAQEYTLEELIEIGLEKSYDIQTEEISYLNSSSYLKSSWLELLPSLSLSASKSNP
ncbi:MAG: hypothetical protein H8E57_01165, partial [Candidatus Cloacimonetes bacterium]|nr:hypothetical protein [Candidatus Cloacimonadota bacterium]